MRRWLTPSGLLSPHIIILQICHIKNLWMGLLCMVEIIIFFFRFVFHKCENKFVLFHFAIVYGAVCLTPKPSVLHADLCWPVFQRSPWNIERDGCSVLTDTCFLFTYRFGRNITEQKTACLQLCRYVDWVAIFVWVVGLFLPFSISITFGSAFVQVCLVECSAPFKLSQFKSSKEFLKVFWILPIHDSWLQIGI